MDDDERTGDRPTEPMEGVEWEETPVQGKERTRNVYIHKKNNAIPNNEKAKKGNPIFTAPQPASDQLDAKRKGGKGGKEIKIHNEVFSTREKM